MTRLYSIQSKLTLISVISTIIIISGGCLSVFLLAYLLSATSLFVDRTLPRIETAKSLEKAALDIMSKARELPQASLQEELHTAYNSLVTLLDRLEMLTAKISQEETEGDILALNWTSQAIRSQAQLVFQLGIQRIGLTQQEMARMQQVRLELVNLPTLVANLHDAGPDTHKHEHIHAHIVEMLTQLNQLELAQSHQEVEKLTKRYKETREAFLDPGLPELELHSEPPQLATALTEIHHGLDQLYALQHRNLKIRSNIQSFIDELDNQTKKLISLTTEHVNSVFNHFSVSANQVIERENQTIYLTILLMGFAIFLLYILHKSIVIRGFGERLSLISRAMAAEPGSTGKRYLPLKGHDEISDMARALDVLLDKAMQLRDLAIMDELTQVNNRRRFFELAETEAGRVARKKTSTILLMMDLDHFKLLNDTYGHGFGDKVLHDTAQVCLHTIRTMDIFARYGGEEFVALLPETNLNDGLAVAERIRQSIEVTKFIADNGSNVRVTMSIGLTDTDLSQVTVDEALQHADIALYQAKDRGRNTVAVWQPSAEDENEAKPTNYGDAERKKR